MRNLIGAITRYLHNKPLLVAFLMLGAADAASKGVMAALGFAA